jgi:PPK2 family polyphosphate:nucleotide phosphotransferase
MWAVSRDAVEKLTRLVEELRVPPGSTVDLAADFDPGFRPPWLAKKEVGDYLALSLEQLDDYQRRLAAQDTYGLLVVIQGIDAAGKDSLIRHVMSGVDPQGVVAHSFKVPSAEELDHDYLWRYASRLPARGQICIFNRSQYEEVLVVRVHPELLERQKLPDAARRGDIWTRRYREINDWERYLSDNGFRVVKLFLNVSKEKQRRRFLQRIDEPDKNWKFSVDDVRERRFWDDYQRAFSEMLSHTSTDWAPWHVLPADHKPVARVAAGAVIVDALAGLDPRYPAAGPAAGRELEEARAQLEGE